MAGRQTAIPSRGVAAVDAVTREGSEEQATAKITTLCRLKGNGENDATLPEYEAFCRDFGNRRELATWVGLAPTSWSSGDKQRDRGIGRDGPAWIRRARRRRRLNRRRRQLVPSLDRGLETEAHDLFLRR
ncbi:MAG: transposase [bacterium]|nr:transposase [bacterium]